MHQLVTRSTWTHSIVGMVDTVFHLTELEKYEVINIIDKLLTYLSIPDRQDLNVLPYAVSLEAQNQFYSRQLRSL